MAQCIQLMMRIDDYRMPFVKVDGINGIVSVLLSNCGFQMQYQLIFSLWLLSFRPEIARKIADDNVIPVSLLQELDKILAVWFKKMNNPM